MALPNPKVFRPSAGLLAASLWKHSVPAFVAALAMLGSGCGLFRSDLEWDTTDTIAEELCFASNAPALSQASPGHEAAEGEAFGLSGRPAVVAKALGLFPLLEQRRQVLAEDEVYPGNLLRAMRLERRIVSRLTLATLNVTAVSARVACEGNRARELADSVERNKNRREDRRTIASILAGAATNVLTGIFSIVDMAVTGGGIGIAGGLAQYGIRGTVEEVDISIKFRHERNFLHDFWDAPDKPELFPPAIWQFLTYRSGDQPSLRERTLAQWKLGRNITDDQSDDFRDRYGVLFQSGGTYNIAQLRARAAMLELLRSSIELMHGDLAELVKRLELESDLAS